MTAIYNSRYGALGVALLQELQDAHRHLTKCESELQSARAAYDARDPSSADGKIAYSRLQSARKHQRKAAIVAARATIAAQVIPPKGGPQSVLDWCMQRNNAEHQSRINDIEPGDSPPDYVSIASEVHASRDDYISVSEWSPGLQAYLAGAFMRGGRGKFSVMSDKNAAITADVDSQMTPHNKREIVFRGLVMVTHRNDGTHRTVDVTLKAGDHFIEPHFTSTSTILDVPARFCMNDLGDIVNSTILEIEISPDVKTIVCGQWQNEIVIERNVVYEVLEVQHGGLTLRGKPLQQYAKLRGA